jgi:hypothetical protein
MKAALVLTVPALMLASAASAKDFGPGDLNVCNARHCLPIEDRAAAKHLGAFYYGVKAPTGIAAPRRGAPYFELRFAGNDYVTGIVASARLGRFLSYGVNLNQFRRGQWYRVPARAARELRTLTHGLEPFRLSARAIARSR